MKCRIGSPSLENLVVPSGRKPLFCCSRIARQRLVRSDFPVDALAALRREERDDVIAGGERADALADLLDDAGALVAEHGGRVAGRVGAGGRVHVGVEHTAGLEAKKTLPFPRFVQLQRMDGTAGRRIRREAQRW
jgi:hypothetical protein